MRDPQGGKAKEVAEALVVPRKFFGLPLIGKKLPLVETKVDSNKNVGVWLIFGDDYRDFFSQVTPLY